MAFMAGCRRSPVVSAAVHPGMMLVCPVMVVAAMVVPTPVRLHLRMLGVARLRGSGGSMSMMMPMIVHMALSCQCTSLSLPLLTEKGSAHYTTRGSNPALTIADSIDSGVLSLGS
jgi:hypothetical protein